MADGVWLDGFGDEFYDGSSGWTGRRYVFAADDCGTAERLKLFFVNIIEGKFSKKFHKNFSQRAARPYGA